MSGPEVLAFPESGLLPAIVQSAEDGTVLMLGWMDRPSLRRTLERGLVTFYSRSRERPWTKGETSGHFLEVVEVCADCDRDAILVRARARGPTCHQGTRSCFEAGPRLPMEGSPAPPGTEGRDDPGADLGTILGELTALVDRRDRERPDGSYTVELLESGVDDVARKVGEEAVEAALASVARPSALAEESADLLYHVVVLWRRVGLEPADVARVLRDRRGERPETG